MEAKKALLLGAIVCHLSVLVHGVTYGIFESMTPNASETFPQYNKFLSSSNKVYYLELGITSTTGAGMLCYLIEGSGQTVVEEWGGVTMLGDYSAGDVCSLVLDDGGYIAVKTYGYYLNIYNLTAYQAAHMADVTIYIQNNGTIWVLDNDTTPSASSPPPPVSSPPSSPPPTASYPPPPSTRSPPASLPPPPPASKTTPPPPVSRINRVQDNSATPLSKFYLPSILFSLLLLCNIAF